MNNESVKLINKKSIHSDYIQNMMAYVMIGIWVMCAIMNNPYTEIVQAIWILYVSIINFKIFMENGKKLSLACTVFLLGYFIVEFIAIV